MKRTKLLIVLILASFFTACENSPSEVADNFKLGLDVNFLEYTTQFDFVDIATGNPPDNVTLTPVQDYGTKILNSAGKKNFDISEGSLTILLNPANKPASGNSETFEFLATAPNYSEKIVSVTFSEENKTQSKKVNMVNQNNTPSGVSAKKESASMSGDVTTEPKTVEFDSGTSNKKTGGNLVVDSGTEFYNKENQKISGQNVEISVVDFDAESESLVKSFPGGLANKTVNKNGSEVKKSFIPMSYTTINMTVGGTEVRTFNKPINVSMEISPDLFNPITGKKVAVGDELSIYSYQIDKDIWEFEKSGTIQSKNNKLYVSFTTNHLTEYSVVADLDNCEQNDFIIQNPTSSPINAQVELILSGTDVTRTYNIVTDLSLKPGDNTIDLPLISVTNATTTFKLKTIGNTIEQTNISCGDQQVVVVPTPQDDAVVVSVDIPCDNVDINIDSYPLKYRKVGDTDWIPGKVINLMLTSYEIEVGNEYEFKVEFDGKTYTYNEMITSKDHTILVDNTSICDEIDF
ncbi:hypothetical protein [Zunongwangia sp.]|uniref:hypothetical protein n=1 Tax=Zunongwangia sp. TaxID=1965325 RepID=UPI003AA7EC8E